MSNGDGTFAQTFVRRNIWALQATSPWDPVTLADANAIKVLQARALTDPTSWTYQSAVHGRTGPVPPGAVWNQCQHGSWYFLPWHRMYLYYFERIVRAEVVAQGGPQDWALPFWDYDNPGPAALPPAFRELIMPDGSANPLRITQRSPGWNNGAQLPTGATTSTAAMNFIVFIPPPAPGFGGGRTTPRQFFGAFGELEFTPHNDVHSLIGGFMGNPNLAALDPIFWLHHANIDRLWSVWL
ncbi:MAG: tyrosinase family protein, partial [Pseudonocardiaceae bacterium]